MPVPNPFTSPEEWRAGLAWFQNRVPVDPEMWRSLTHRARRRAFSISKVTSLDALRNVWLEMERSIAKGTSFEEFKQRLDLSGTSNKLGISSRHLELVFNNQTQLALNAGRYHAHKNMTDTHPFWQFSAKIDSKTSEICNRLDKTTLPEYDRFWVIHYPPLHHRCRSIVKALTEKEAIEDKDAKRERPKGLPEHEGWGDSPRMYEWQPPSLNYPAELRDAYQKWRKQYKFPDPPPKFTSLEEAKAWVVKNFGNMTCNFDNTTLETIQPILESFYDMFQLWPNAGKSLDYIGVPTKVMHPDIFKKHPNSFAVTLNGSSIILNPDVFNNIDKLKRVLQKTFDIQQSVSPDIQMIFAHEFGHAMHEWINRLDTLPRRNNRPRLEKWLEQTKDLDRPSKYHLSPEFKDVARQYREAFAEAFTEMSLNPRETWSPFTRALEKFLASL